ncbi:MAG: hypothetical protein RLZZ168_1970 [Cyanobacteriota bacterium]
MRRLSWQEFDRAVEQLAAHARQLPEPCGIHGVPRGGLVLAVALSHRLELPLLEQPRPWSSPAPVAWWWTTSTKRGRRWPPIAV